MRQKRTREEGFGLLEIVIGVAIISFALLGVVFAGGTYERVSRENRDMIKASFLASEGIEAMRSIRDGSFSAFTVLVAGTPYYLVFSGTAWQATDTPQTIDGLFTRTILLQDVLRDDTTYEISTSSIGTHVDADIREVISRVVWAHAATGTRTIEARTYLSNIFE